LALAAAVDDPNKEIAASRATNDLLEARFDRQAAIFDAAIFMARLVSDFMSGSLCSKWRAPEWRGAGIRWRPTGPSMRPLCTHSPGKGGRSSDLSE